MKQVKHKQMAELMSMLHSLTHGTVDFMYAGSRDRKKPAKCFLKIFKRITPSQGTK